MTGYMMVLGPCWSCGRPFSFNADHVPSHRDENGVRQPVCGDCMARVNAIREENGLPPHPIHPMAYQPQEGM